MYLTFDKDILSIGIENNDGIFYDKINDIKEIKINIKPYNYIKMVQSDYEPNLSKTNGRRTGSVEHRNKVTVLKSEDDDYNKDWNDDKANLYYIPNGDMLAGGGTELIKEDSRSSLDVWLPDYKVGGAFPSYMSLDLNE